jgi:hypothetical protein
MIGIFLSSLIGLSTVSAGLIKYDTSKVLPFRVDLESEVPRMLDLVKNTRLPEKPEYPGLGSSFGMDLSDLKRFQDEWLHGYSWAKDQAYINRYGEYDEFLA